MTEEQNDDFAILARLASPITAQILTSRLQAEGVAARLADLHLVQTHSLLTIALGGVRILVPQSQLALAQSVMASVDAGEFELGDELPGSES